MQGCLTFNFISGSGTMIDHRYFYFDHGRGHYTCGLARQGLVAFFRTYTEEDIFLSPEWIMALYTFKNNPSVVGFTVEQIIISKIVSTGLRWGNTSICAAPVTAFPGSVTELSKEHSSRYYIPLKFNLKAIDALYAEVNDREKTAKVVAIQIAVPKPHRDSMATFFADWHTWTSLLIGFKITTTFLWIVEGKRGGLEVQKRLTALKDGSITTWPAHTTSWVSVDQIDISLAMCLKKICPNDGDRDDGHEDEAATPNTSPRESHCIQCIFQNFPI